MSIEREVKIMGIPLKVIVEDDQELELNSVVSLANEKYIEVARKNRNIVDSNRLRAIAIFNIVTELQTIKGDKENIKEKNNKKIKNIPMKFFRRKYM